MPQFKGESVDIWRSNRSIRNINELNTGTFVKIDATIDCELHDMSAAQKLMSGMNVGQRARQMFVDGPAINSLKQYDIVKDLFENTFWLVDNPVQRFHSPHAHWRAQLVLLTSPPSEVS